MKYSYSYLIHMPQRPFYSKQKLFNSPLIWTKSAAVVIHYDRSTLLTAKYCDFIFITAVGESIYGIKKRQGGSNVKLLFKYQYTHSKSSLAAKSLSPPHCMMHDQTDLDCTVTVMVMVMIFTHNKYKIHLLIANLQKPDDKDCGHPQVFKFSGVHTCYALPNTMHDLISLW